MSGGGKAPEQKPSPLEKAQTEELTKYLFPAGRDLFEQGTGGIYQGTQYAGSGPVTRGHEDYLYNTLYPLLTGQNNSNMANLQGFYTPEDLQSVEDIYASVPSMMGLYNDTIQKENLRAQNQINNLVGHLGRQSGETFGRNILPQIQDQAAAAGQFTSSKAGLAEGIAAADLQNDLNQQISGLYLNDLTRQDALRADALDRNFYNRNTELDRLLGQRTDTLNRSLTASSLYGDAQASQLVPQSLMQYVGDAQDTRSQSELEDYIQMYNAPRNAELTNINDYASLIYGAPQFQHTMKAGKSNPLMDLLGLGTAGVGLVGDIQGLLG